MVAALPGTVQVTEGVRYGDTYGYRSPGHPPIVTWHTTETGVMSRAQVASHRHPPHLWINPATGLRYQTVSMDRPALALLNGGIETNHRGPNIQIEVFGRAAETHTWPAPWLVNLADLLADIDAWLQRTYGQGVIDGTVPKFWQQGEGVVLATVTAPQRMDLPQWYGWNGSVGHQHAPGNDHWDPGGLDVLQIHRLARKIRDDRETDDEGEQMRRYLQGVHKNGSKTAVYRCDGIWRREILPPYYQDRFDPGWRDRIVQVPVDVLARIPDSARS